MKNNITIRILFIASQGKKNILVQGQKNSLDSLFQRVDIFAVESGVFNYLRAIFKLNKYLSGRKYDIIHAHYGWSGIVAAFARKKEKLIVSFMGDDLLGSVNKNGHYTIWSKGVARLNIFFSRYFYDHIIVKSNNLADKLKGLDNVTIIPNGVEVKDFHPVDKIKARKKLGWKLSEKYILFISNPVRQEKNYELARKANKILGDSQLLTVFNVKNNELYLYYSAADCLLLTSYHEGSPNVIKEAMACNCPIVSTDVGDVKWVLGNTGGCFITSYDPNDVADKLKRALEFSSIKGRTNGRKRILELGLDAETTAHKILNVYHKVLNTPKNNRFA